MADEGGAPTRCRLWSTSRAAKKPAPAPAGGSPAAGGLPLLRLRLGLGVTSSRSHRRHSLD
eukprot:7389719-Prymnesium_polylepis.1